MPRRASGKFGSAQPGSNTNQADQQSEKNSAVQKPRSEQQDGTETQASQDRQPQSNEEGSGDNETTVEDGEEMSEQAAIQWLRKIPDDPGGLLRRKFIYQYKNRGTSTPELNQW